MSNITSHAPGKLMICGEYSVLFKKPSLIVAIDRQATCTFSPSNTHSFTAKTYQQVANNELPLYQACIIALRELGIIAKNGEYILDTSAFFDSITSHKYGLGSSSAAIVSFCKNVLLQNKITDKNLLLKVALKANNILSGNCGSGVDIRTSIEEKSIAITFCKSDLVVTPVEINLLWKNIIFVDTKKPQSTKEMVKKLLDYNHKYPEIIKTFCHNSEEIFNQIIKNITCFNTIVEAFELNYLLLDSLSKSANIDIISIEHKIINKIAKDLGGTAKPSGAGGGDIAMALIPIDKQKLFSDKIKEFGFSDITLNLR